MKHLINMNYDESHMFNRLLAEYKEYLTRVEWDISEFTCRYSFKTTKLILDCVIEKNMIYKIHAYEENYAMLARKAIPPFDMKMSFSNGSVQIVQRPKNEDVVKWLYTFGENHKRMVKDELGYIIIHSLAALNGINPIFRKRQVGDTIEYSFPPNFLETARAYLNNKISENNKKTLLDGWDVVALTEKQFYKVIETNQKNKVEYDLENIALPKFCLSIYDGKETDYYFFEKQGRTIHCGVTDPENFTRKFFNIKLNGVTAEGISSTLDVDDKETGLWKWLNEVVAEDGGTNWEWCADAFFIINTFMLHYGDVTMEVEEKQAKGPSDHRAQKHNRTNSVRLFKTYKLIKNWRTQARKKAEITCPAWGVRGHFRHLRNGKTVFVEAYIKGPKKDEYKGKEYNLIPYKDA